MVRLGDGAGLLSLPGRPNNLEWGKVLLWEGPTFLALFIFISRILFHFSFSLIQGNGPI